MTETVKSCSECLLCRLGSHLDADFGFVQVHYSDCRRYKENCRSCASTLRVNYNGDSEWWANA